MGPKEPHTLSELFQLRMDVADESNERACAPVGSNEGASIWAAKRILGMVADGPSKETTMHV